MSDQKICAWITRHHPTRWQSRSLRGAGYSIRFIPTREKNANRIMEHIDNCLAGLKPAIIVAAHPVPTLHHLARLAPCPVLIAEMDYSYQRPKWRGVWNQFIERIIVTPPFNIEESA